MSLSLFLICEMGRCMLALHDIPQLLTGMLKLDAGSCTTCVHSRLFPSGRMETGGDLTLLFISFWGCPPPSPAHRFYLLLWEILADFLAAAPQARGGVWRLLRGPPAPVLLSHRRPQLSGGPLLDSIFTLFLSSGKRFPR